MESGIKEEYGGERKQRYGGVNGSGSPWAARPGDRSLITVT